MNKTSVIVAIVVLVVLGIFLIRNNRPNLFSNLTNNNTPVNTETASPEDSYQGVDGELKEIERLLNESNPDDFDPGLIDESELE